MDSARVKQVALKSCTQVGKTTAAICWVGKIIENESSSTMWVMPDGEMAKDFSQERWQPFVESTPTLRSRKDDNGDRYKLTAMHYEGMWLWFVGSNSAGKLASRPVKYIVLDEINKYKKMLGDEAGPIKLVQARTKTYMGATIFCCSSPTNQKGAITTVIKNCDEIRVYHVPCPHCGEFQELIFEQVKFERIIDREGKPTTQIESVWYECSYCHEKIPERHKRDMLDKGKWVSEKKAIRDPESVGFRITGLYSPFPGSGWKTISEEFLSANNAIKRGDPEPLRHWRNSTMGEEWEEKEVSLEPDLILARRLPYREGTCPADSMYLTLGADVGEAAWHWEVRAWAPGMKNYLVAAGIVSPPSEDQMLAILNSTFTREDGLKMQIGRGFIDSRYNTERIYNLCRTTKWKLCPIYGQDVERGARTRPWPTKINADLPMQDGNSRYNIPVVYLKDQLSEKMELPKDSPGSWNVNADTTLEYCQHVTAEERVLKYDNRTGKHKILWELIHGRDNHWWDCDVYAYACALAFNVDRRVEVSQPDAPPAKSQQREQQKDRPARNWVMDGSDHSGDWING